MGRGIHKLTARGIEVLKTHGIHGDGGGLYLRIGADGSRRWTFIYVADSKRRELGLGAAAGPRRAGLSLADARRKAAELRQLRINGKDPYIETRARRKSKAVTFGEFADDLLPSILPEFRNALHQNQWRHTVETACAPLRSKPIASITTDDVLAILNPFWETRQSTAMRIRGRLERILDAARARGLRSGENPAGWRGHLRELLARPKQSARHHTAMAYNNVPAFVQQIRASESVSARALEFLILTAARTREVTGARFCEFDLNAGLWTIPAVRMKAGKTHRVPLSDRALEIIKAFYLPNTPATQFVFPGLKGAGLGATALYRFLNDVQPGMTVHGFRSSFRDWAGDATAHPRDVAEAALAHALRDKTEAAYRRSDALQKRRELMRDWAQYIDGKATSETSANAQDRRNVS